MRNILILSYFFPPCNKVGGRRWAKFAKYLVKNGHSVHVICVDVPFSGSCPWEKDTEEYKNSIIRLSYIEHRPYYRVNKSPSSIGGKILYRLSWYKDRYFSGSKINDISSQYGKTLCESAESLIKERKIDTIIVTGGPFHWCYKAMQLKKKHPGLNFILDLRDFWTGGELYLPLNDTEKAEEDMKEFACMELADHVFTPAERIAAYLKVKYPAFTNKVKVLPHAFDKSEMPINISAQNENKTIRFAYGGVMYSKMQGAIENLITLLKTLIASGQNVKLDLYTFDETYKDLFVKAGLSKEVAYHHSVKPAELFAIFSQTDYLLQLRAGESQEQHFKSTKFYELIALRRPIIYFGPDGDVSQFIVENKLGFSGNMKMNELCERLIENKRTKEIPAKEFDVSQYDFSHLTKELERAFNFE
jgi:glycosyltransferase involved in cell wall biosynthesis